MNEPYFSQAARHDRLFQESTNLYFCHIPRTGGKSIKRIFPKIFSERYICRIPFSSKLIAMPWEIVQGRIYGGCRRGHLPPFMTQIFPMPLISFTFLRDPVARTLSHFKFIKYRNGEDKQKTTFETETKTILQFVRHPTLGARCVRNWQTRFLGYELDVVDLVTQYESGSITEQELEVITKQWIRSEVTEEMFQRAKQRLLDMSFVGVTDRYGESCRALFSMLSINYLGDIPHWNASPTNDPLKVESLTNEERQAIEEATAYDRELYELARKRLNEVVDSKGR